ncbi:uncharacterized protein FRV6_01069 [Fusarium oxysporum]|uniref:Uncharacterized protein n=1 Tax=Fusarium oxysporum TaxID=5507 RepID=A0A2H3SK46_FUSOX|nr:uncharacterized protein FRV6_01069 [Fusarium oxysporum]
MREGAGIDALFKLACYADLIVLLDSISPRSQVINQKKIALKAEIPPLSPHTASRANNKRDESRSRTYRREEQLSYASQWLRRLDSALRLKEFVRRKDFSRDLVGLEYEVDPNNPDESDDAVITPDIISWYALFEVNRKELDKDRVVLGRR